MDNEDSKRRGYVCPYCGSLPERLRDSSKIYGSDHGPIRICWSCVAWVSEHKNGRPKGMLARKKLRAKRKKAHDQFDKLWKNNIIDGLIPKKKGSKRSRSYIWISRKLGIKKDYCHIGMMDEVECDMLIDVCEEVLNGRKK